MTAAVAILSPFRSDRETCPRCGGSIWYPTDAIGRLVGRCDRCRVDYRCATKPAPLKPSLDARRETADNARNRVFAYLIDRPNCWYSASQIARALGLAERTAANALYALRREHRVRRTGRAFTTRYTAAAA